MRNTSSTLRFIGVFLLTAATAWAGSAASGRAVGDLGGVGKVEFPTSCNPDVQETFERGLALLHSFFYEEARRVFTEVASQDPDCAMAYWGIAMTHYHPIWAPPDSTELAAGLAAVEKALAAPKKNERERGFIRAIEAYYKGLDAPEAPSEAAPSCHGLMGPDTKGRAACFRREMEKVATSRPDDVEAASFYALSLLGTAPPGDPQLANQRKSAEILEPWYAKHRDHPGLAHYLIHTYDYPPLAEKGLPPAENYASIAPWVPHALHMPSHIFTRLGMWKENIESNLASAEAARKYAAKHHPGAISFEELHAIDYLIYGYLQTAQDQKAKELIDQLSKIRQTHPESDLVVAYAMGAAPARFALERRQWKEATTLTPGSLPFWSKFLFAEGHMAYARAVGAARLGDGAAANAAAKRLGELATAMTDPRQRYFADQMETQRRAALALVAFTEGRKEEAIVALRQAAAREDSLGKHPVSPGAILPVRELLAEALLESGNSTEALAEFEASLKIYPGRLNGLYGAGLAAERAGAEAKAASYYHKLVEMTSSGDGTRIEVRKAKTYLKG